MWEDMRQAEMFFAWVMLFGVVLLGMLGALRLWVAFGDWRERRRVRRFIEHRDAEIKRREVEAMDRELWPDHCFGDRAEGAV